MRDILTNPGVLTLVGVLFTGLLAHIQQNRARKDSFHRSNLSVDDKKTRLLRWNQEQRHTARMLMIQNGLGELVEKHLPFDPPKDLMLDNNEGENK